MILFYMINDSTILFFPIIVCMYVYLLTVMRYYIKYTQVRVLVEYNINE